MAPPNQTCNTAVIIPGLALPFGVVIDTTEAGNSPSSPDTVCGSGSSFNSVWYRWICPAGITLATITVGGATGGNTPVVTVYSGLCGALVDEGQCTGDGVPLTFATVTGRIYFFLLTSMAEGGLPALSFVLEHPAPAGDFCAFLSCAIPPPGPGTNRTIRRLRRFPLPFDRSFFVYVSAIEFLMQTGEGLTVGQGEDPLIDVRFSTDGGRTWGNLIQVPAGKLGEYFHRPVVNRIGRMRNGVCEIAVSDPVFWYMLAAYIEASEQEGT